MEGELPITHSPEQRSDSKPILKKTNVDRESRPKSNKINCINYVDPDSLPFKAILSVEETRELECVNVWVADIDARHSSDFLRFCKNKIPALMNLNHLKRFRRIPDNEEDQSEASVRLTSIIGLESVLTSEELQEKILTSGCEDLIKPYILPLPKHPALNRVQFDSWRHVWPMSFKEDPERALKLHNNDATNISKNLDMLRLKEASAKVRNEDHQCAHMAIVVDSHKNSVIADSSDICQTARHPLDHSVMRCIARVAENELFNRRKNKATCSPESHMGEKRKQGEEDPIIGYLCSGLDVYLTTEPCAMCSMALLHSRIGRVFYLRHNPLCGALGSQLKLHTHPSLNHKFKVFCAL